MAGGGREGGVGLGATTLRAVTAPAKGPPPSLSSTNSVLPRLIVQ